MGAKRPLRLVIIKITKKSRFFWQHRNNGQKKKTCGNFLNFIYIYSEEKEYLLTIFAGPPKGGRGLMYNEIILSVQKGKFLPREICVF